ncbi:MAG: hypothetical protein L0323_14035 [Planctomycetes bacterium]|nr:hypothetical protein [Planctomycetota bacterium]
MKFHRLVSAAGALLCATAAPVSAQVLDCSFEAQVAGLPPGAPWVVTGGIATISAAPDDMFPSDGANYLSLNPGATGGAVPAHGPHAAGTVGQVAQTFVRPAGATCTITVDWEFIPLEFLPSPGSNDFLSIDVIDTVPGTLVANVVFIDTGTLAGVPAYTNVPGAGAGVLRYVPNQAAGVPFGSGNHVPAGFKRAWADLSAVPAGTLLTVAISVGNALDTAVDSVAYIDTVCVHVGETNADLDGQLRVLGSAHIDGGPFISGDFGAQLRPEVPYSFRTSPGQRLGFRANGDPGAPWILAAGPPIDPGVPIGNGATIALPGILNIAPSFILTNGFSPPPFGPGFLGPFGESLSAGQVPEGVPLGITVGFQAGMLDLGTGAIEITAATYVEVRAPDIPVGAVLAGGTANADDGFFADPWAAFGAGGGFAFYGIPYLGTFVASNGFLTFVFGTGIFAETEDDMQQGPPRIAVVWDDLYPPGAGSTMITETALTYTASWTLMEEVTPFLNGVNGNNFSVQLYQDAGGGTATFDNVITLYYGSTTMVDGLVGITPGGLAPDPPGFVASIDLSGTGSALGGTGAVAAGTTHFQRFALHDEGALLDLFDVKTIGTPGPSRITYVPDGAGGYIVITGTR